MPTIAIGSSVLDGCGDVVGVLVLVLLGVVWRWVWRWWVRVVMVGWSKARVEGRGRPVVVVRALRSSMAVRESKPMALKALSSSRVVWGSKPRIAVMWVVTR